MSELQLFPTFRSPYVLSHNICIMSEPAVEEDQWRTIFFGTECSVLQDVQFNLCLTAAIFFMVRSAELCTTGSMKKSNNIKPSEAER